MGTYLLTSLALTAAFSAIFWGRNYKYHKKSTWIHFCIRAIVLLIGTLLFNWLCTPTLAFDRPALYWELLATFIFSLFDQDNDEEDGFINALAFLGIVILGVAMIITSICSGRWVNTEKHRSLLEMSNDDYGLIMAQDTITINQDSLFNEGISPVSLEKMRTVSPEVAQVLAEAVMGQIPAFGSQYEIGELSLQSITGSFDITDGLGKNYHLSFEDDFIYVAPLEFRSFWKWRQTKGISPAYIIVSATNENLVHMVTAVNGQPLQMKYLQSACFNHQLRRHVRRSGFMGKIEDTGIQIDGNGRPYNVFAQIDNQIGWGGDKVIGSIVVDIQTGEVKNYGIDETPDFIDVIQPMDLTHDLIYKRYDLIHGYINWSDQDRLRPNGLQTVYGQNECCYYAGLTSVGNDASTSGFILVNAQTGVGTFYKMSGIDENRAESAIHANEWTAKYPSYTVGNAVMYNIGGLQTYYAPIISGRKIVGHGFCSVKNVNVVGAGKSKEEAYAAYIRSYHMSLQQTSLPSDGKDLGAQILTIKNIRQEGSRYNFLFEEYEGKTFYSFSEITPSVRWIERIGAKVKVDFRMSEDDLIPIQNIEEIN